MEKYLTWLELTLEEREIAEDIYISKKEKEADADMYNSNLIFKPINPSDVRKCRFQRLVDGKIYVEM